MIVVLAIPAAIVSKFAGDWGVPYFSFTTDRGGKCTNNLVGYSCDQLTVADIAWWGDVDLPEDTEIVRAHYEATHKFNLDAVVVVPKENAKSTYQKLHKTFGSCGQERPSNLDTNKLKHRCIMANQESDLRKHNGPVSDRDYVIDTGLRDDGSRVIGIQEKAR